ncbi:hypothetical protein [Jatrophihabitans sp.]|uniref:hypothetical protein n=1 Tax=Jatrophihabitans sp. TaxID=1932789 RepID=UPI002B9E5926|nr:hypothetical protein [Jatrophihabitans sp.]
MRRRRGGLPAVTPVLVLALVAGMVSAAQLATAPHGAPARADEAGTAGLFVPAVGRLLDTRNGTGGYSTAMPAGSVRTVAAAGQAGIPTSGVSALALSLTAVGAGSIGSVSVAPGDVATPTGTALVFNPGDSVSNTALVALHADGTLHVVADHAVQLIIDVQGYFTAGSSTAPGGFVAVNQTRIGDTRSGLSVPQYQVQPGSALTLQPAGLAGIPADASAVYVNIAVLNQAGNGYLRTYATGTPVPSTGALDFDDTTQAVSVAVPLSSAGEFSVLVGAGGPLDLIIDIQGYFTPRAAAGTFTPAAVRLLDTRVAPVRTIAGNSVLTLPVAGVGGLPGVAAGLAAVALNLRTVQNGANTTAGGYLRLWPGDQPEPATSNLNYTAANTYRTDLAIVAPAADGTINIRNGGPGAIDVVVDAQGWFRATAPATPTVTSSSFTDGQFDAVPDAGATFTFTAPPGVGNTSAARFEYVLDDGPLTVVDGSSGSISLGITTEGPHNLVVIAQDANGTESDPALFYVEIGHDAPATPPAATDPQITVSTTDTAVAEDGTSTTQTSTQTSGSVPAQPAQVPNSEPPPPPPLFCNKPYRGHYPGATLDLLNVCRLRMGTFGIRLTPPAAGSTQITPVAESGFIWYVNGYRQPNTPPHPISKNLPITHTFTGNFKPLPLGAHVWGFDSLAYSFTYNRVLYIRKVKVTIDFVPVP